MNDWQTVTNGMIAFTFSSAASTSAAPVVTVNYGAGGEGKGYIPCVANPSTGCFVNLVASNAYHELGHVIGLNHFWERSDSGHYFRRFFSSCDEGRATNPKTNLVDFGPYDYRSTMQYSDDDHPSLARWNGWPLEKYTEDGIGGFLNRPPTCHEKGFGRPVIGYYVPTCSDCSKEQPYGFPSPGDAGEVVEIYRNLSNAGWKKFLRTVEEDTSSPGVGEPWNYDLASTRRIAPGASPALSAEPLGFPFQTSDDLTLWIRGKDTADGVERVYHKSRAFLTGAWSGWSALTIPTAGTISDPAAVSWAAGRQDLVITEGGVVYIRTNSGSWGGWGSLGAPTGTTVASAPAITSWATNRLDVLIRGADNKLYHKSCTASCSGNAGTWSNWNLVGSAGTFQGKPSVISRGVNLLDVFVNGNDGRVWVISLGAGGWGSTWFQVPALGTLKAGSAPAAAARGTGANGPFDIYIQGQDDKLWVIQWEAGVWYNASPLGGALTSSPGTVTKGRNSNRTDVVATMSEENTIDDIRQGVWWKEYAP